MSFEQRNHDFSTALVDAQAAYIEAEREVERFKAENAKLQEQDERLFDKTLELAAENVKLRELVRDMWEFGFGDNSGANDAREWHEKTDALEDRLRELGVEV